MAAGPGVSAARHQRRGEAVPPTSLHVPESPREPQPMARSAPPSASECEARDKRAERRHTLATAAGAIAGHLVGSMIAYPMCLWIGPLAGADSRKMRVFLLPSRNPAQVWSAGLVYLFGGPDAARAAAHAREVKRPDEPPAGGRVKWRRSSTVLCEARCGGASETAATAGSAAPPFLQRSRRNERVRTAAEVAELPHRSLQPAGLRTRAFRQRRPEYPGASVRSLSCGRSSSTPSGVRTRAGSHT
jgi:hypothetical protein